MAEIRDDHIKCDDSDPLLNIRIPERLLYWVDEAAEFRGISTEELINEFLYDNFGKTLNTKGEYQKLHAAERKRRRQLTTNRYIARKNEQRRTGVKQMTPYFGNDVDWRAYEVLRAENLKLLEATDYETRGLQQSHRTSAETEALRVALESKGISRNFVRVGEQKFWLRRRLDKYHHGHILKTKPKSSKGVFMFRPADVKESDELIQTIIETADEIGAVVTATRMRAAIERLKVEDRAKKLKNPTK